MTVYARPGSADALMSYEPRYGNFIGGEWVPPVGGEYFENPTPVTGQTFCEVPRSNDAGSGQRARLMLPRIWSSDSYSCSSATAGIQ